MGVDLNPVFLSLKAALIATCIVFMTATALAYFMNKVNFVGKSFFETIIILPLVLPPTVIGYGLLLLLGKNGPLGMILEKFFNFQVVFTWWAVVIAACVVAFPLMYRSTKAALETVDSRLEQAARTLGSSEVKVFLRVTLPLAWPGIVSGILLAFARALGEFGATLMLAGNIPGETQTVPLAIYFAAESGDMASAGYLVAIITTISFVVIYFLNKGNLNWQRGDTHAQSGYQKSFT